MSGRRHVHSRLRACVSQVTSPALCRSLAECCILLLGIACASQPLTVTPEPVLLQVVAADSCGSLARGLAASYEERRPWVTVEVNVLGASEAEKALRAGEAGLALLSWLEEAPAQGDLWSTPFARDGIAVITHPNAPFGEISLPVLREVFRGRIQEWGGLVLTIVSREEGSGTRAAFESVVLGDDDATFTAVVVASSEAVVEYVAETPASIGYVSTLRLADGSSERVRVLPVDGVSPVPAAIAEGSYVLSRPLLLASIGEPTGEGREFAKWVLGAAGQVTIGKYGNW